MCVVWNPGAGRKAGLPTNADLAEDQLADLLRARGIAAEVCPTETAEAAREQVRRAVAERRPAVVAAGGDGTLRGVARTLLEAGPGAPALGILPLGSVMNVARSLGIPRELEAAADVLATGHERRIDVGLANGEPFFEAAAIGLHAAVFEASERLDRGDPLAPARAVWAAIRYRPSRMRIRLDRRMVSTRALVVSVSNGPYTGLGFTVAPGARLDDGLLDVRVFERFSRWELLTHFWSIMAGRRRYEPRVETHRSAVVRIASVSPLPVRVDGESIGTTPVELGTRRGALRVIAPPAC